MNNDTMLEGFKYLNYCQLATGSLVSKIFWKLLRSHRHKLVLLYVDKIFMTYYSNQDPAVIELFNKELSPEEYNEWIVCNGYLKRLPFEGQIVGEESTKNERNIYNFRAEVFQNPNHCHAIDKTVLYAHVELSNETWPLFQHFARLLMDPFIYICSLELKGDIQNDLLCFFAGAMNPNRNRLQCKQLKVDFTNDTRNCIVWIKDHMRCDKFVIDDYNYNIETDSHEELLDLFLTGASCTSAICFIYRVPSKVIADFVQKFMGLNNRDECQVVESIRSNRVGSGVVNVVKRKCAEEQLLIAEEQQYEDNYCTGQVIGFINNNIKKKLTLNVRHSSDLGWYFSIKITNL